jgi:hypothetical protein
MVRKFPDKQWNRQFILFRATIPLILLFKVHFVNVNFIFLISTGRLNSVSFDTYKKLKLLLTLM